jgi:hypothetical protein
MDQGRLTAPQQQGAGLYTDRPKTTGPVISDDPGYSLDKRFRLPADPFNFYTPAFHRTGRSVS